jgi:hypothetical protein
VSRKRSKWARWLASIHADLDRLALWQATCRHASASLPTDDRSRAFEEIYLHAISIGIRRQLKLGSRNVSLARLLEDIAAARDPAFDAATARQDLAELRRASRSAEAFADRVVAHLDRRSATPPNHSDIARALATLEQLHAKYTALLHTRPH